MTTFAVTEAKAWHCGTIVRHLRHEHRVAIAVLGLDGHRPLRELFDQSSFRRSWTLNGRLAGVAGITGTLTCSTGFLWFAMTDEATRYPIAVIKEAKRFLDEAMLTKRELATTILGSDEAAKRLAVFLGFHVSHEGLGAPALSRASRRTLSMFLETNPDVRVPIGNGYAIAMGYHLGD
jgi:hypothetical protein